MIMKVDLLFPTDLFRKKNHNENKNLTWEHIAIFESELSIPVLHIAFPLTFILGTACVVEHTVAVSFTVGKLTNVEVT